MSSLALPIPTVDETSRATSLFGGIIAYWTEEALQRRAAERENTISGTPTTAGTFTFTVRVTDDLDAFSEKELSITIS
jgi:Putative Ig domain